MAGDGSPRVRRDYLPNQLGAPRFGLSQRQSRRPRSALCRFRTCQWMEGYARSLMDPAGARGDFAEQTVTDWPCSRSTSRAPCGKAPSAPSSAVLAILRRALLDLLATVDLLATGDVRRTTAAVHQQLATVG